MSLPLLERHAALRVAQAVIARARSGQGGIVVFEGVAGIGKSSVLAEAAKRAGDCTVATARPTELERAFDYSVALTLLQPSAAGASSGAPFESGHPITGRDRLAASKAGHIARTVLDALLAQLMSSAAGRPLVLVVDDAQWADEPSMGFLRYAAPRLSGIPVAILVATRPVPARETGQLLRLLTSGHAAVVRLAPLSRAAVHRFVARQFGGARASVLAARAFETTGGNPFLLSELLAAWDRSGVDEDWVPTTPELRRAVVDRVAAIGRDAVAVADAVAVLGGIDVTLADAAALAGLPTERAALAADALGDADVLHGGARLSFVQPIVREAVYATIAATLRSIYHARAARRLAQSGGSPDVVAAHLLAAPPANDPWVVALLRHAAGIALGQGAPDDALRFLRRALSEPPPPNALADVYAGLGEAAARGGTAEAEEFLRCGLAKATRARAAAAALALGRLQVRATRGAEAIMTLHGARARAHGADAALAARIDAELVVAGHAHRILPRPSDLPTPRHHPELRGTSREERARLASLAIQAADAGAEVGLVHSLATRALAGRRLLADEGCDALLVHLVVATLAHIDRYDAALAYYDALLDAAQRGGSPVAYALALAGRADVLVRAGRLLEARTDALAALAAEREHDAPIVVPLALFPLVMVRLERAELADAWADLERHGLAREIPLVGAFAGVHFARGCLYRAQGEPDAAGREFLAAGEAALGAGIRSPAFLPWRSQAAMTLAGHADAERATRLVAEELRLARAAGTPRALGLALGTAGLLGPQSSRAATLRDAAQAFAAAGSSVELARTLTDLGVAQLRGGSRREGRETLRRALDLADRHAATATADRARAELLVAGARPRRSRLSGPESLTAAELRIALLALDGRSNRQIAAELFLSLKTVETHLSHVYMKLSVNGRGALRAVLGGGDRSDAAALS